MRKKIRTVYETDNILIMEMKDNDEYGYEITFIGKGVTLFYFGTELRKIISDIKKIDTKSIVNEDYD